MVKVQRALQAPSFRPTQEEIDIIKEFQGALFTKTLSIDVPLSQVDESASQLIVPLLQSTF